ncbi:MAG: hypothetical protein Q4B54_09915, partial [Coriobacteriales bacterium]|nr:hypothetical protein [Coriobacteriales bacterium]
MVFGNHAASKSVATVLAATLSLATLGGCGTPNLSVVPLDNSSTQSDAAAERAAAAEAERALTTSASSPS